MHYTATVLRSCGIGEWLVTTLPVACEWGLSLGRQDEFAGGCGRFVGARARCVGFCVCFVAMGRAAALTPLCLKKNRYLRGWPKESSSAKVAEEKTWEEEKKRCVADRDVGSRGADIISLLDKNSERCAAQPPQGGIGSNRVLRPILSCEGSVCCAHAHVWSVAGLLYEWMFVQRRVSRKIGQLSGKSTRDFLPQGHRVLQDRLGIR